MLFMVCNLTEIYDHIPQTSSLAQVGHASSLRHPNVILFMGLVLEPLTMVVEFCARGSLADVLRKAKSNPGLAMHMNWTRLLGIAMDAAKVRG